METKFKLIVIEPAGWNILDTPRAQSYGALKRRSEPVGKVMEAYDILEFGGVPYAYMVPQNSMKTEWGRVSEAGGVIFDENGNFQSQVLSVKTYVKVIPILAVGVDAIAAALHDIADAIRLHGK